MGKPGDWMEGWRTMLGTAARSRRPRGRKAQWARGVGQPGGPGRPPEGLSMPGLDPGAEESKRPRRGQRLPQRTAVRKAAARTFACRRSGCSPRSECQSPRRARLRRAAEGQSHLPNVWNEKITGHAREDSGAHAGLNTPAKRERHGRRAAPRLLKLRKFSRAQASVLGGTAARG
jgi:hypothetical protein